MGGARILSLLGALNTAVPLLLLLLLHGRPSEVSSFSTSRPHPATRPPFRRPDPSSSPRRRSPPHATTVASSSSSSSSSLDGTTAPKRIVVLGGGFGGLNTALTLASLPWPKEAGGMPEITLVDRKERFVFLPLLYELCVGDAELEEVAPTFRSLLRDSTVSFLRRDVRGIDVENSAVYLSDGSASDGREAVPYDALVVATGADVDLSAVPGAEEFAMPFYTVEDCFELKRALALFDSVAEKGRDEDGDGDGGSGVGGDGVVRVVVVGGGYSGVELALNAKERLGRSYDEVEVTLVHRGDGVLQYATEYNRNTGIDRLRKAGIRIRTQSSVVDVRAPTTTDDDRPRTDPSGYLHRKRCTVTLRHKTTPNTTALPADLLLWTAGASSTNTPTVGVLNSLLPRDSSGRIVTDAFLRASAPGYPRSDDVFAVGDRARVAPRSKPHGATAQVAIQQAAVAGWNVYASLTDGGKDGDKAEELPFRYLDLGEMLTLGEEDASITSLGGAVALDGAGASVLRRLIYAVRMPTARQALVAAVMGAEKRLESVTAKERRGKIGVGMEKKGMSWK